MNSSEGVEMRISDEELELFKDWKPGQPITIDQVSIGLLIQEARYSRAMIAELVQAVKLQATREQDGFCFCVIPTGHEFLSHESWCKVARSVIAKVAKSVTSSPEQEEGVER